MSRLVAFGCSYTYGKDLADPATQSWPAVLSKLLDLECDNQAVLGAGNLEILWNIINYKFQPGDTVFIMWSHFSRDHIFEKDQLRRIRWDDDQLTKHWILTHSDYDVIIRNWLCIQHGDLFVKKFASVYHLLGGTYHEEINSNPDCIKMDNLLEIEFINYDYAGKNKDHPGLKSHTMIAEKIYKCIQQG